MKSTPVRTQPFWVKYHESTIIEKLLPEILSKSCCVERIQNTIRTTATCSKNMQGSLLAYMCYLTTKQYFHTCWRGSIKEIKFRVDKISKGDVLH